MVFRSAWRVFLLCLLLLALPLQGLARPAMDACAQAHGVPAAQHDARHEHASSHLPAARADAGANTAGKAAPDHCQQSAACCVAAPLPAALTLPAVPGSRLTYPELALALHCAERERLDRPPRNPLA